MKCPDGCDQPNEAEFFYYRGIYGIRCPNCYADYSLDRLIGHMSGGVYSSAYVSNSIEITEISIGKKIATIYIGRVSIVGDSLQVRCELDRPGNGKALVTYLKQLFGPGFELQMEQVNFHGGTTLACPICGGKVSRRGVGDYSSYVYCEANDHFRINLCLWAKQLVAQNGFVVESIEGSNKFVIHLDLKKSHFFQFDPSGYDINRFVEVELRWDFRTDSIKCVFAVRRLRTAQDEAYQKILTALRSVELSEVAVKEIK